MIVFIAGMQRSGSTYTFNIARELLERDGSIYQDNTDDLVEALRRSGDSAHVLLKAHTTTEFLAQLSRHGTIRTICSIRGVEESAASWMDVFGFDLDTTIGHFKQWFEMYRRLRPYALTIPYRFIEDNPKVAAASIAHYLFRSVDEDFVAAISDKYSKANVHAMSNALQDGNPRTRNIGFSFYDVKTFFHRRHVGSLNARKPEDTLSRSDLARIQKELSAEIALVENIAREFQSRDPERSAGYASR